MNNNLDTRNETVDDSEAVLNEILAKAAEDFYDTVSEKGKVFGNEPATASSPEGDDKAKGTETHTQWALGGNGRYMPVGATVPHLPPGIYETFASATMWGLERSKIESDGIYILPDMPTNIVLDEAKKFWSSESRYKEHGLLFKRGIIMFGPPGGGKTVALKLLMNDLVKSGGIVIIVYNVGLAITCLKAVRRIEPTRPLIIVMEDIDEILAANGEASVLSMLDGENNVSNVLCLATTNYPERLGARIINRPSRFDRRIHVGMPSDDARRAYLEKATAGKVGHGVIEKWVKDTKEMSIAHLRELVAAVYCLEQPYEEVIGRLKQMAMAIKSDEEFRKNKPGFGKAKYVSNNASGF